MTTATVIYDLVCKITPSTEDVNAFAALFAYAGFNPEMVHAHFAKIKEAKTIDDATFTKDLLTLITLGCVKGNYSEKNSKKVSDEGKKTADALYSKYQMKKGSVGTDVKAITLPRVLSAFPELTTKVVTRCPDKNYPGITSPLPRFIKNPVFAAMVPSSLDPKVKHALLVIYSCYTAEQTMAITAKTTAPVKDFSDAYAKQTTYTEVAHNSSVPPEAIRVHKFKKALGAITEEVVETMLRIAQEKKITIELSHKLLIAARDRLPGATDSSDIYD